MDLYSLLKANSGKISSLLDQDVSKLLKTLGYSSDNHIKNHLIKTVDARILLINKKTRDIIFSLLSAKQREILATILDLPYDNIESLESIKIPKGSEKERDLFRFFEVPIQSNNQEINIEGVSEEILYPKYSLFSHQRNAAFKIKQHLRKDPCRVILHMPTGAGKTRTAMNIIADHLRDNEPTLVIWLAYSEELCEQAVQEFHKAWQSLGDRPMSIYRFWGSHDLDSTDVRDGFIVAGLSKLYNTTKKSIQFINRLGARSSLVIIDEAHQAIAETYSLVLDSLVVPYEKNALLGLTATPGRTWNNIDADAQLSKFFANNKVTLEIEGYDSPVDYLVDQQYLAKANYRSLFYDSGVELSLQDIDKINQQLEIPNAILKRLEEDEQRNLRIILELEDLTQRHQRIIFFAISVHHAKVISTVLKVRGYSSEVVTGETPKFDREKIISNFKNNDAESKILCNYGVLTTGFDAPKTSAAVIARPTKSLVLYSQMVGRAIRGVKAGGNETAEIVTVVDNQLPGFGSVTEAFHNWEDVWRKKP
ncbi:DEAD/DEAH box helicase [Synechocystis sp. PCC 7339]|uniref:DEAD/DEAH box helicase n=1 Tax=unclassified Synechocystis TaxID=2640012 RepID=UPI001BB00410|nr:MULTISPECIES: DEAD/DEAH box helicase [unclassified Synechocystis]QUS61581.1 DEAD/DEAH box helicase [Synechocystis sp. PCC 7338]UAJ73778.1 DEAD/DEAH box helicase [Synechocystis sp. PCC 7339]